MSTKSVKSNEKPVKRVPKVKPSEKEGKPVKPSKPKKSYEVVKILDLKHFTVYDYSDKSNAIIGDTKRIKDKLKEAGCLFNGRLSIGPGWIINKLSYERVISLLLEEDNPIETPLITFPTASQVAQKEALLLSPFNSPNGSDSDINQITNGIETL